ncbi:MAG: ABC transporter substrate-binding protein [Phycisphaerales bacterium]|nr:ABC transporter substrate-binding protein [Phycisphaerales bacterium]
MKHDRTVGQRLSRREVLRLFAAASLLTTPALLAAACSRATSAAATSTVTVYCSLDRDIIEPVLKAAGTALTLTIEAVYDTEATKTTGLALRLRSEAARPRADLWLSSEAINTANLAAEGLLDPLPDQTTPLSTILSRWPKAHRTPTWVQLALRARVIVHNPKALDRTNARPPESLLDFAHPRFKGRAAIADPRFGTTRGHLALLHQTLSAEGFRIYLQALKANELQIVPGNAAVVRAVARGEAHLGITDIDDLRAAERESWPVVESPATSTATNNPASTPELPTLDPRDRAAIIAATRINTPTTLAFVRSAPNPAGAQRLAAWLLEKNLETALAVPQWGAQPVDPLVEQPARPSPAKPTPEPDWSTLKDHITPALNLWQQIMG